MAPLLFDENFNQRIARGLLLRLEHLDTITAHAAGLDGVSDPELLNWASDNSRLILTHDRKTMPDFYYELLQQRHPLPALIVVPPEIPIGKATSDLAILLQCARQDELKSVVIFLPLD